MKKYLTDNRANKSIDRDAATLQDIESFVGDLPLERISNDAFARYRMARRRLSIRTRNPEDRTGPTSSTTGGDGMVLSRDQLDLAGKNAGDSSGAGTSGATTVAS